MVESNVIRSNIGSHLSSSVTRGWFLRVGLVESLCASLVTQGHAIACHAIAPGPPSGRHAHGVVQELGGERGAVGPDERVKLRVSREVPEVGDPPGEPL